ncbi:hypothetical protein MRX96_053074 [Rhipicephalus microplus]
MELQTRRCPRRSSALWTFTAAPGSMDVIGTGEGPFSLGGPVEGLLKVVYGRRVQVSVVINGSLWPYEACLKPKSVSLDGATATECVPPFALIMVDPDAPTVNAATERSRVHWMVINAKSATELHKGEQVMLYESPTPPPGTGTHRFVFLVYCQRGKTLNGADVESREKNQFRREGL